MIAKANAVWRHALPAVVLLALAGSTLPGWADELAPPEKRGKQIYRDGIAADGTRVTATLGHGVLMLPGAKAPCASCHGPDGLGRPDAGLVPSNITWANLTKPYGLLHANGRSHPPYTADALITAVTAGVDPAGNALDPAMPRYTLSGPAAHDLVAYLKRLGRESDPGVGSRDIIVAAVVPTSGRLAGIGSVVERLVAGYLDRLNRQGGIYNRTIVMRTAAFGSSGSAVDALRLLMDETDIFAVLAPAVFGQEAALAAFAESAGLPLIGSLAQDQQRAAGRQGFTFYLAAGLDDQVHALVKYAQTRLTSANARIALLSSDDGAGLRVADAIRRQSGDAEWTPTLSLQLSGDISIADVVSRLRIAAVSIIYYDGGPTRLVELAREAARSGWRPAILTTGLALTRESLARLSEASARVFVTYPLLGSDQSPDTREQLHSLQASYAIPAEHLPIQVTALAAAMVLVEGLQRGGRDLTRAKFVAALAALQDFETGLMPPISFGSNRRTGVRGAHVVALGHSQDEPEHVWIPLD
jgi:ABC-type branched-subunit amino acid transport system substrate-binding protein